MSLNVKPIDGAPVLGAPNAANTSALKSQTADPKLGWSSLKFPQTLPHGVLGGLINPGALNPPPPPPGSGPLGSVIKLR
jgi:hypothetical protein